MFIRNVALFSVLTTMTAPPAGGEVIHAGPGGFEVAAVRRAEAAPDAVYAELVRPQQWWNGDHSFSGDAANLSLEAKAGGCFCERLPDGGSAAHMTVVLAQPGQKLRLHGALGPLQGLAVKGAMTWTLKPADGGTEISLVYTVGGYVDGGLELFAAPVDGVMVEQLERLVLRLETGSPEPR